MSELRGTLTLASMSMHVVIGIIFVLVFVATTRFNWLPESRTQSKAAVLALYSDSDPGMDWGAFLQMASSNADKLRLVCLSEKPECYVRTKPELFLTNWHLVAIGREGRLAKVQIRSDEGDTIPSGAPPDK